MKKIKDITQYPEINDVLGVLARGVEEIFGGELVGLYLIGSLSYGAFEEGRSDIDLVAVLKGPALSEQVEAVKQMHLNAELEYKNWAKRIECGYITLDMLQNILPPKNPRPYYNAGKFYPAEFCGNEWIINLFFLYKYGIALIGPDFKTLMKPVDIAEVQKASARDLYKEWVPKINDPVFLENSHYQSYIVLNLCRILHAVARGGAVSKPVAAEWAKTEYPQWKNLIETASAWHYGTKMARQPEVIEFIKFTAAEVKEF